MTEQNKTTIINGNMVEIAKLRKGTKCKCCGKDLYGLRYGVEYYPTHTQTCEIAYVCSECVEMHRYGDDIPEERILKNKLTKGNYRISCEIEFNYKSGDYNSNFETIKYLIAQWKLMLTYDCTVDGEFKMLNVLNFHGIKAFFEDLKKYLDMDAPNCGHHLNVSKFSWSEHDINNIRYHGEELFNPLADYLYEHREDTIRVFGRYFGEWAKYNRKYEHGSWLNLDNYNRLEFRLPHFVNVNQFTYCANLCRDYVDILDKWLHREITTEKASEKMIHEFKKYAEGRACCQRAERNKIDR